MSSWVRRLACPNTTPLLSTHQCVSRMALEVRYRASSSISARPESPVWMNTWRAPPVAFHLLRRTRVHVRSEAGME